MGLHSYTTEACPGASTHVLSHFLLSFFSFLISRVGWASQGPPRVYIRPRCLLQNSNPLLNRAQIGNKTVLKRGGGGGYTTRWLAAPVCFLFLSFLYLHLNVLVYTNKSRSARSVQASRYTQVAVKKGFHCITIDMYWNSINSWSL